jgi:hypothetical protein
LAAAAYRSQQERARLTGSAFSADTDHVQTVSTAAHDATGGPGTQPGWVVALAMARRTIDGDEGPR